LDLEVPVIVDAHVSIDRQRFPVGTALDILNAAGIRSAVVFADARSESIDEQNRYVLRVAQEHGLHPFYYLGGNPYTDTRPDELVIPDNLDEYAGIRWHRWVGEGIDRVGGLDQDELDWAVNLMESAEFEALVSAAAHYGLPVLFEESFSVTLEFVLRFPSLDVIVPHLGARSGSESTILRALWDQPNVYFDTSLAQLDETTLSRVGPDRILFGSGLPEGDPSTELDKIDRLPVPESVKEGMYGDNLLSLLSAHSRESL
jgi:predicted TIM-barrel fold metal-dependent hydrolase